MIGFGQEVIDAMRRGDGRRDCVGNKYFWASLNGLEQHGLEQLPVLDAQRGLPQQLAPTAMNGPLSSPSRAGTLGDLVAAIDWGIPRLAETPVTPEMIAAGKQEIGVRRSAPISDEYWAERIYRAMNAATPVGLVSEGERITVKERDEALNRLAALIHENADLKMALADLRTRVAERDASVAHAIRTGRTPR